MKNVHPVYGAGIRTHDLSIPTVDSKQLFSINFAYDWIRTVDFGTESDRSTNWGTTTALIKRKLYIMLKFELMWSHQSNKVEL